jgi:TM2 domain-containing membrane protein YozV
MRPKSRIKAILLALFTGFVGGHKFYLGKAGGFIGFMILFIVSLNVFRSPILSFIAGIVDAIKLINMSDELFNERYNGASRADSGRYQPRSAGGRPQNNNRSGTQRQTSSAPGKGPIQSTKANALKVSGLKKYKDFDLEAAIDDFTEALQLMPGDPVVHFNLACAYSLTEKKERAYFHLSQAVATGLKDVQKILSHDDLAFVRIQPEFETFRTSGFRDYNIPAIQNEKTGNKQNTSANPGNSKENELFHQEDALLAQLQKLSELRQKGILSEDEFQFERKKILRN